MIRLFFLVPNNITNPNFERKDKTVNETVLEWQGDGSDLRVEVTDNGLRFQFNKTGEWLDHETDEELLIKFQSLVKQNRQQARQLRLIDNILKCGSPQIIPGHVDKMLHETSLSVLHELVVLDPEPDTQEGRWLDKLAEAVSEYEKVMYPIAAVEPPVTDNDIKIGGPGWICTCGKWSMFGFQTCSRCGLRKDKR